MATQPDPRESPESEDRTLPGDDGWPVAEEYREATVEPVPPPEAVGPGPPARRFPPDLGPGLAAALVGVLLLVILIPAGIWLTSRSDDEAGSTGTLETTTEPTTPTTPLAARTVPEVVGLPLAQARARLREARLDARVRRAPSEQPRGEVLRQAPEPRADVPPNGIVLLTVSAGSARVVLPRVEGTTVAEATATLRDAGLRVEIQRVPSSEPEGTVVAQTPAPGEEIDRTTVVVLEVAEASSSTSPSPSPPPAPAPPPPTIEVPQLVGMTSAAARDRLGGLGLRWTQRPLTSSQPKGTVVRQSPSPGAELREGGTVTLTVSTGPATIDVPDVVGLDAQSARAELRTAGFRVQLVEEPTAEPTEDGVVLRQTPRGGASRPKGTVVTITVARFS